MARDSLQTGDARITTDIHRRKPTFWNHDFRFS